MTAAAAAVRAPRLMLIVEAADVAARREVIAAALGAGVDAVQVRDRRASPWTPPSRKPRASCASHSPI